MNLHIVHPVRCSKGKFQLGLNWLGVLLALMSFSIQAATNCTVRLPVTGAWTYTTNSQDGINWTAPDFGETGWSNAAPAPFYIETDPLPVPKNTSLPARADGGPMSTYYFRTTVEIPVVSNVLALQCAAFVDDGVVLYLNGVEVQRLGITNHPVTYDTSADRFVYNVTGPDTFTIAGDLLTNLVAGINVLAAEVHQQSAASSDVVFAAAMTVVEQVKVIRGPYLQNGSATNITVRWRTDVPTSSLVRYGTNLNDLSAAAMIPGPNTNHEVRLSDLLPDTKYFYAFGGVGGCAEDLAGGDARHFFITAPLPGVAKPTRIWVLGDSGTANIHQINVRNAYEAFTGPRHTDLWLMLGDNAYNLGLDSEFQTGLFNIYTNLLPNSVLWPALGNHDTAFSTAHVDTYPYFDVFTLPKNGEAGGVASGKEHYYSFDYGNIHFICLDSVTSLRATNGPMYAWLTNDLAHNRADWTIAFWHHPPYSKGGHDSDISTEMTGMRRVFLPALERGGVDLVMTGHSHSYERSYLLDGHYGFSTNLADCMKLNSGSGRENESGAYDKPAFGPVANQGTVYVVAGSSGQASGGALNHPTSFLSRNNLGSLVLDVNTNRLDVRFIRETGAVVDHFTIRRGISPVDTNHLSITGVCHDAQGHSRVTWNGLGGKRYRLSYRDGNLNGPFTDLILPPGLEVNTGRTNQITPQSFLDDFTLTPPRPAARFYRIRQLP